MPSNLAPPTYIHQPFFKRFPFCSYHYRHDYLWFPAASWPDLCAHVGTATVITDWCAR